MRILVTVARVNTSDNIPDNTTKGVNRSNDIASFIEPLRHCRC